MFTERDITAHGYPFTTATTKPSSGLTLARQLQNVEWKTEAPVRLISCFSANGGSYASQAQVLANRLQRDVTGYYGLVTANRASDTVRGTYRVFSPQTGLTAIRTGMLNTTLSYLATRRAHGSGRPIESQGTSVLDQTAVVDEPQFLHRGPFVAADGFFTAVEAFGDLSS
uniref:Uncharacterized protein n=1 Tax=Tanacetum cinerariifolium TaxID=118510 RepID=A0A699Q5L8_TANCI|nr:hypothetical protein [Tanacetum cinerariifolium]